MAGRGKIRWRIHSSRSKKKKKIVQLEINEKEQNYNT